MRYFSTFSGIGGFELGIGEKGECIGYSEIDKYATQVYQKHFNHKNYGDITKINEKELPDFDLLVGGFPCQSFSIAGKRGGFSDTRGTMFFELVRILNEKQPRLFVFENVKGLLSHDKGATFVTIISTLDELGYDIQWQVLNSKNHGVPQNRERVFIVGHLRGTSRPEVFPIGENSTKTIKYDVKGSQRDRVYNKEGLAPTIPTMQGGNTHPKIIALKERRTKAKLSETCNTLTSRYRGHPDEDGRPAVIIKEATKKGYAVAKEGDSINLSVPNSKTRRGRVGHGVAQTIDTGMQQHTLQNARIRRLTPKECERLQGFPDDWTKEGVNGPYPEDEITLISDTQRYKMCGNAVTVNVIRDIMLKIL